MLMAAIQQGDESSIGAASELLSIIFNIFFSLNFVEFPAFFEDNLKGFMEVFKDILLLPIVLNL